MADQPGQDRATQRLAESVRRALSLVGPAEQAFERLAEDEVAEDATVSR